MLVGGTIVIRVRHRLMCLRQDVEDEITQGRQEYSRRAKCVRSVAMNSNRSCQKEVVSNSKNSCNE